MADKQQNERQSENQAVIDVMERLHGVERLELAPGVVAYAVPKGQELESVKHLIDEYLERPDRKRGTTRLTTLEAFCAFVNRHKQVHSVAFCDDTDPKAPKFVAVFNAHQPSDADALPDWQDFRAVYGLPLSDEWLAWTKLPKEFTQLEFAAFLEDRITDVVLPSDAGEIAREFAASIGVELASPARLMELSRGLTVHVDGRVTQRPNISTGEAVLMFTEEHKDATGQPLKVPGAFVIGIPVFRGGVRNAVPVRLRYRVDRNDGGKVFWSLAVQRLDRVFEAALVEAVDDVARLTELPVYRGAPQ